MSNGVMICETTREMNGMTAGETTREMNGTTAGETNKMPSCKVDGAMSRDNRGQLSLGD